MNQYHAFALRFVAAATLGLTSLVCQAQPDAGAARSPSAAAQSASSAAAVSAATARDAMAQREMLVNISTRLAESESRARANEAVLTAEQSHTKWIAIVGAGISVVLALLAGFAGFYFSRHLQARQERELIDAGKEPLAVLITKTRDDATRLAQRLKMHGQTNTRLFQAIVDALPALQVEAGKATFNLSKQIPRAEHSRLEGSPTALDPLRSQAAAKAIS